MSLYWTNSKASTSRLRWNDCSRPFTMSDHCCSQPGSVSFVLTPWMQRIRSAAIDGTPFDIDSRGELEWRDLTRRSQDLSTFVRLAARRFQERASWRTRRPNTTENSQ